jgi:N-acetylmuramoyl-L-alanine amidase
MRRITHLVIHCSATPAGREHTVEDIRRWHIRRGFEDIGYHYVITLDGCVHKGRPEGLVGAHVEGHNAKTIGICYVGGTDANLQPKDTRTPEQRAAMLELLCELKGRYPDAMIVGHSYFNRSKACPSFDAGREYASL